MLCIIHPESFFSLVFFWSCLLWWKRKEKCREKLFSFVLTFSSIFCSSILYVTLWPFYGLFQLIRDLIGQLAAMPSCDHLFILSRFFAIVFEFGTKNLEKLWFSLFIFFTISIFYFWMIFMTVFSFSPNSIYMLRVK